MSLEEKSTVVKPVRVARGRRRDEVACLEVVEGLRAGDVLPLTTGSTLIGRTRQADLVLEDEGVSRRHAKVAITDDGVVNLIDLDSTNGTLLNGARIDLAIARDGDRIQIGPEVVLRFSYRTPDSLIAASKAAPVDPAKRAAEIGLSPRELDVARLVADGLTNDEVSTRLSISSRTVATHLSRIYDRLDLPGRAALARLVVQHGLLE